MFSKSDKVLAIVESPEKSRTISKIFKEEGYNNVKILATVGHFTKIADGSGYSNTGVHPENNFEIDYKIDTNKRENTAKLKDAVKYSDKIYICTDADREGEAIAWSCRKFLNIPKSKYKRVTYQAINKKAIFDAFNNPRDIDEDLVDSAHCRGGADIMIGYRISSILRDAQKGKSAGRVQSVTLGLVVEREEEIRNFKPEKYIDLYLHFFKNKTEFKAKYVGTDKKEVKRLSSNDEVVKIFNDTLGSPFIVKSVEKKDRKENPKAPFSTATFQQECSNKLGLTVKEAQDCAQKLFESGKISYHRTDSERFDEEFENELKTFVNKHFDKKYVSGSVIRGKVDPNAQEGHESLHVLDLTLTPDLYEKECQSNTLAKIYRIIYNRTVATALKPAIISQTTYNIYNKDHKFVMNSNELKFDGYRCVYAYKEESDDKEEVVRETFSENEELKKCSLESVPKETTPPSRYKEASLVAEMKKLGIGRPSTYSTTIDTLKSQDRGYCVLDHNYLVPTEKGIEVSHFLVKNFPDLFNVKYTSELESSLDLVASGKLDYLTFMKAFYDKLEGSASKVSLYKEKICPNCGSKMIVRNGPYGKFYGCSNYPKCKHLEKFKKSDFNVD